MAYHHFQQSFTENTTLSPQLFNLLEIVFPGLEINKLAEQARRLGAAWEDASTPFVRFHEDASLITHIGVLEIPMRLMGQNVTVGGIHAVCTHPEFRRRGYYREVMTEVLDYCDTNRNYPTLILTTSQPELYQPFGFRVVQEHSFTTKCNSPGGITGCRLLDIDNTNDIKLLHRLLETRAPISNIVGVINEKPVFLVNEASRPLYYFPDLDAVVCMSIENNHLRLFDVVTPKIFPLQALLAKIPQPIEQISIYFSPDCINPNDSNTQALPEIFDDDSLLMVRGTYKPENQKFTLPRSARC
jgi:GNAT superfamily N-acetyltransferase